MDLVKSHLLYAVGEEVRALKAQIFELTNRITMLETENNYLRANASLELLNSLYRQPQLAGSQTGQPHCAASTSAAIMK